MIVFFVCEADFYIWQDSHSSSGRLLKWCQLFLCSLGGISELLLLEERWVGQKGGRPPPIRGRQLDPCH